MLFLKTKSWDVGITGNAGLALKHNGNKVQYKFPLPQSVRNGLLLLENVAAIYFSLFETKTDLPLLKSMYDCVKQA